jgi:dTMP kinase
MNLAGKFIVLDGPDGSGKDTQLDRLAAWIDEQGGRRRRARDPGGTEIGERIRRVLLDFDLSTMDRRCETLLFMASRAQLVAEVIRPALDAGETMLCGRYISATCAYQGAVGVPPEDVLALGRQAVGATFPHLTIVLDVPPEVCFGRIKGRTGDAMERRPLEFHRRVRELFRQLPALYPTPVVLVDADREVDAVWHDVQEAVRRAFP